MEGTCQGRSPIDAQATGGSRNVPPRKGQSNTQYIYIQYINRLTKAETGIACPDKGDKKG